MDWIRKLNPVIAFMVLMSGGVLSQGQNAPPDGLHTAEQVRQLTPEQATRHYPVQLRAVVTFFDANQYFQFVQDDTAGIYFSLDGLPEQPPLAAGQLVEIAGEADPGEYAPVVLVRRIQILGRGIFPVAKPVTFEQLASGQEDSQFVEIRGIVRAAYFDQTSGYFFVEITTGGGRLTAYVRKLPVAQSGDLVDSTVTVRGVCVTRFNRQRQLFDIRLLVPRPTDLAIDIAAASDPFTVQSQPIEKLLQFTPQGPYGHRVKVTGTVIYQLGSTLYIEDEREGLHVETTELEKLLPGDKVEVLGFPAKGEYTPKLQDAIFRKIGSGPLPTPDLINTDEALKGTHDCRLVRIVATVLDRARHSPDQFLELQTPSGVIFHAYLESSSPGVDFAYLQNGSKVAITGVCLIETGSTWVAGEAWRAKSFRIFMRSPGDISVLQWPPWWDLQKLFWVIGILGSAVFAAIAWVLILRLRVHKQTRIIRDQLQKEAALKERYEELFENANDMVFTNDLGGRITSINKAGERLLQRPREAILGKNMVEFLAEEQREPARQWFEQVIQGAELAPAEWEFMSASGQRLRLELSARLVSQAGQNAEVESMARNITERKRLEREILEISNREQRRIGHDLHDGVCQQLAAIAYRMDIMADQLQEKGLAESSEVEKIGGLVNETITQTRRVARGLFPVRLEENGLVSAIEEFAANAESLFNIQCQFSCDKLFLGVENSVSLHLYYIIQEAVLNAVKHGKATRIQISITHDLDHFVLAIRDNGTGFQSPGSSTGMGIRIMRYRSSVIGSTLDLKSTPGQGTQITCAIYPSTEIAGELVK
ncbi:MAG TPA: PAS domain S-box protein [Verrucomicrobiae bacterium]|nr:PAS domain S-box protein [Verrucomicrobiae bacterium]